MFNSLLPGDPIPKKQKSLTDLHGGGGTFHSDNSEPRKTADIRDSITALVGNGVTDLTDEKARAHYLRLQGIVGTPAAQKLVTTIMLYNKSPHTKGIGLRDKVSQFYDISHADEDVNGIVKKARTFGSGVLAGMMDSSDADNMELVGKRFRDVLASMTPQYSRK